MKMEGETDPPGQERAAVVRLVSLPSEISFPCGLPLLQFLIDDDS